MSKRSATNVTEGPEGASIKNPKNDQPQIPYVFPIEKTSLSEDMVVGKHPLDLVASYIPFLSAGNGTIFIQRKLLVQLNQTVEKVTAGIIVDVPDFPDRETESYEDWRKNSQEYWNNAIGTFLHALDAIGETNSFIVCPFWYINVNWSSLDTICKMSNMSYDVYIQACEDEEYEWHSEIPRYFVKTESAVVGDHIPLGNINMTMNYKLPEGPINTSIWLIDSEINFFHLAQDEAEKVHPQCYEYSSDPDDFNGENHGASTLEKCKGPYEHGTIMCKTMCGIISKQAKIHFVKIPKLYNNQNHILQALKYISITYTELQRKYNVILLTLGSANFRSEDVKSALYVLHLNLHKKGFVFICSAGNIKFLTEPRPETPKYPYSFFLNCSSCVVVGAHAMTLSKLACPVSLFESAGCCTLDERSEKAFVQGVHTWAIGEKVVYPKTKYQECDSVRHGTSIAAAIVTATATHALPNLPNKSNLSRKFKELVESSSSQFVCTKHQVTRSLVFSIEKVMDQSKYQRIG